MSITFVGVGASGEIDNSTGPITLGKPSVVENDLMLAFFAGGDAGGGETPETGPTGWRRAIVHTTGSGTDNSQAVWWKFASDSEPATYDWDDLQAAQAGGEIGQIAAWRGVDQNVPFDTLIDPGVFAQNDASPLAPGITTITDGAFLIAFFGRARGGSGTGTPVAPAGMTERINLGHTSTATLREPEMLVADLEVATAGATGDKEATGFLSTSDGRSMLFALRPAGVYDYPSGDFDTEVASLSPLRHYKLDETSGLTATDDGSDGADGAYEGSPTLDKDGPGLSSGDRAIGVAGQQWMDAANITDETITIEVVAKKTLASTSGNPDFLVNQTTSAGATNDGWGITSRFAATNVNNPAIQINGTAYNHPAEEELDVWTHYVLVLDTVNGHQLWVNGVGWNSEATADPDLALADRDFRIGGPGSPNSTTRSWDGDIAHVAVYDGALTPTQILDLFYLSLALSGSAPGAGTYAGLEWQEAVRQRIVADGGTDTGQEGAKAIAEMLGVTNTGEVLGNLQAAGATAAGIPEAVDELLSAQNNLELNESLVLLAETWTA